ncbi:MAG: hypothetical protein KatS3mg079_401 [Caloramator sp.]|nr:MAG: hypothetical protein KatS3mg079_401 [Caloramator sp.]
MNSLISYSTLLFQELETSREFQTRHSMVEETTHLGVKEQLIFPEIEYDKVEKLRGMDIVFVTTAKTDEEARELLRLLGMPFAQ